ASLAPAGGPPGTEPLRMRKTQVRLFFLQTGQGLPKFGTVAQRSTEHGVDETTLGAATQVTGQLHGFMNGGVVRNAVQPKDLVEPEAEEDLEEGFLGPPLGFAGDHPIESGLPAG